MGNACYISVGNLLSSSLLSKNIKIKINRTIIFPVIIVRMQIFCYHVDEHRLRVLEHKALKKYSYNKTNEIN